MPTYNVTDKYSLLLLWITDRLKVEVDTLDLITKDAGQLEVKERPAVADKTVLISFENWVPTEESAGRKHWVGDVIVKSTHPLFDIVHADAPQDVKENALKFMAQSQEVFEALEGWQPQGDAPNDMFGKLINIGETEDKRRPGLGVMVTRYRISCEDASAVKTKNKTAVQPNITVRFDDGN